MNIIPIIAKADTIAKNELHKFKSKIMSELVSNGVQIYQFPTDEETVAEINATMSVRFFIDVFCCIYAFLWVNQVNTECCCIQAVLWCIWIHLACKPHPVC